MTCIVGFIDKEKDVVYIGADSLGSDETGAQSIYKSPKVFKITNGEDSFTMGGCHSFRMLQVLQYKFVPPRVPQNMDIHQYMCTLFINSLQDVYKNANFTDTNNYGNFLVAYKNRLFVIESDFHVGEYDSLYASVGSGRKYADGAMYHLKSDETLDGHSKVEKALESASYHCNTVKPPFVILDSTPDKRAIETLALKNKSTIGFKESLDSHFPF